VIGLDTNILLRLWLNDDPAQGRKIDSLLDEHGSAPGSLLVSDVVLAEALWTLRASYGQGKADQLVAVRSLLKEPAFAFEDREAVELAASLLESNSCGFSDCLIVARHSRSGCDFTATFDKRMRKLQAVRVL